MNIVANLLNKIYITVSIEKLIEPEPYPYLSEKNKSPITNMIKTKILRVGPYHGTYSS